MFPSQESKSWKDAFKRGKNHRQSSYDATTLGWWGGRCLNHGQKGYGHQGMRSPGCAGSERAWGLCVHKSRPDKWHNKETSIHPAPWLSLLPKCFAFEGSEAFMRSLMNFRGRLGDVSVLRPECFQPHHFPRLKTGSWKSLTKGRGEGISCLNATACFSKYLKEPGNKSLN